MISILCLIFTIVKKEIKNLQEQKFIEVLFKEYIAIESIIV